MASVLLGTAGTAVGGPFLGYTAGLLGSYVDNRYLMPRLAGKGRSNALPPRLLDLPVGSNEAGAPRIWAIGGRVRVPTHVLWQKEKVRETTTTHHKAGTTDTLQREVMIDCLLSLNDRKTVELTQLVGNGKLLIWESRNLVRITTHEMTAAVSGADVVITMANTLVPSPTDVFKVGDFVKLHGWVSTAGPTINGPHWRVSAIAGHTSVPGTITLQVVDGQSVAGVAANAGHAFTPAHIERVDDALIYNPATVTITVIPLGPGLILLEDVGGRNPGDVFSPGHEIKLVYASSVTQGQIYKVQAIQNGQRLVLLGNGPSTLNPQPLVGGNTWFRVEFAVKHTSAPGFFAPGYVPKDHFHDGSEDQGEDAILVAEKGTGNVPAYRGQCYLPIDREAPR